MINHSLSRRFLIFPCVISGISGERIWVELKKIVVGNYAGSIMKVMYDTGIAKYMGEFLSSC